MLIQLGTSGGFVTSGYESTADFGGVQSTSTSGFLIRTGDAANSYTGIVTIQNVSGNIWVASGIVKNAAAANTGGTVLGIITIASALTQVRLTTSTGTFDSGSVNIIYG